MVSGECSRYDFKEHFCPGNARDCCGGVEPPTPPPTPEPPTPAPAPVTPTPPPTPAQPKNTSNIEIDFDITQQEESMEFFVRLCYDHGSDCADWIDCNGYLTEGEQVAIVDNDAQYFKLHFGTKQRMWHIKNETSGTWPEKAETCNSFNTTC